MKKLIALIISLAFVLTFVSCNSGGTNETPNELEQIPATNANTNPDDTTQEATTETIITIVSADGTSLVEPYTELVYQRFIQKSPDGEIAHGVGDGRLIFLSSASSILPQIQDKIPDVKLDDNANVVVKAAENMEISAANRIEIYDAETYEIIAKDLSWEEALNHVKTLGKDIILRFDVRVYDPEEKADVYDRCDACFIKVSQ